MCSQTLSHPPLNRQDSPFCSPLHSGRSEFEENQNPPGFDPGGQSLSSNFDPYFLIQGNNSSDSHKQGVCGGFDDFQPDYAPCNLPDRLGRYAKAHSRALEMSRYLRDRFKVVDKKFPSYGSIERSIATDLQECGSFLLFHHYHTINEVRLASMCSCKRHLLCPLCAIRRAAKSVKVYLEKFNLIMEQSPRLKPYLVTFTVKDGSDLSERFDHLHKSLRNYYANRRKYLSSPNRNKSNEACKALGGVGSYEVKKGAGSGEWHPHAHFVWVCDGVPDPVELSQEWFRITGDSFIVDVTPFTSGKDVEGAFLEVFKYALKYSGMNLSDNWEAFTVLQRRRLVSSFGLFYGLEIPEQLTDEISYDELPYIELIFRFIDGSYRLTQSTNPQGNEQSE